MNSKKGFTLVELLAVIAILGVLSTLAIAGYTKYIDYSKQKAYKVMAKSASIAAEEYLMDHPGAAFKTEKVSIGDAERYVFLDGTVPILTFDSLKEDGYLASANDPANQGHDCKGYVTIGAIDTAGKGKLTQYIYSVDLCCSQYQTHYNYTYERKPGHSFSSIEEEKKEDAYCPNTNNTTTDNDYYVTSPTPLTIGEAYPDAFPSYPSAEVAIIDSGGVFLKHVVKDGIIRESYVGIRIGNGQKYGYILLRGGNHGEFFDENMQILQDLPGIVCANDASDPNRFACANTTNDQIAPFAVLLTKSGAVKGYWFNNYASVNIDSTNNWCEIESNNVSKCSFTNG